MYTALALNIEEVGQHCWVLEVYLRHLGTSSILTGLQNLAQVRYDVSLGCPTGNPVVVTQLGDYTTRSPFE